MENWRKYLNEGIDSRIQNQIDKFLANKDMYITIHTLWHSTKDIMYTDAEGNLLRSQDHKKMGLVRMKYNVHKQYDNCLGEETWVVTNTNALEGMGPLLYEVAIEYASQNGNGLIADRYSISSDAHEVWSKYALRSDVERKQLDISKAMPGVPEQYPQITPNEPDDDCYQGSAVKWSGKDWNKSPLSSIFSKNNTSVTDAISSKLIIK